MSPKSGTNPPQPQPQPQPQQFSQANTSSSGGTVFGYQGTGNQIIHTSKAQRGPRIDTRVLLVALVMDVAFFFYGMSTYTGRGTTADNWHAGIFLFLLAVTGTLTRRWIRRRV